MRLKDIAALPNILDLLLDAVCVVNANGRFVFVSASFETIFGYSPEEVVGKDMIDFVLPEDRAKTLQTVHQIMSDRPQINFENRYLRKDGQVAHVMWSARWSEADQVRIAVARDVTQLRQSEVAIDESERRFRNIFDATPIPMALNDSNGNIRYLNKAFIRITGYTQNDIPNLEKWWPLAYPDPEYRNWVIERWQENLNESINSGQYFVPLELKVQCKDGSLRNFEIGAAKLNNNFAGDHLVILQDITERKQSEERIQYLAYRDALTSLPNRVLLRDRVEQSIANAHRQGSSSAVLFIFLDDLKNINDSLGHIAGDAILVEAAQRLTASIRETDTVGRLGGDEFLVLLASADAAAAAHVAQKLLTEIRKPYVSEPRSLNITPSIGIALYPKDGTTFDELLKAADIAMYRAKREGRNAFRFYTEDMNQAVIQRMMLENNLYQAIERKEFRLHYQPKFELKTRQLIGVEALIRWDQPEMGMIPPAQFIPIAEATGLIERIGKWVLGEACRQAWEWKDQGLPSVRVAVNISQRQFAAKNIVEIVTESLKSFDLSGDILEIEITESLLAHDTDYILGALLALRTLGVHIAVDDFGTGYSSLSYLKRFPIDRLKIDQSFVRDLETDPNDRVIATAVVTLGHSLGMKVIAEGVETVQQMHILAQMDCDEIQGYYLGHPMPADDIKALLKNTVTN